MPLSGVGVGTGTSLVPTRSHNFTSCYTEKGQ